jgi:hypothetical protein
VLTAKGVAAAKHPYAYSQIGTTDVSASTTDNVLSVLRPIWTRTPETGSRLRGRIEAVLHFPRVCDWRQGRESCPLVRSLGRSDA